MLWLIPHPDNKHAFTPLVGANKVVRGWSHPVTARILCPRSMLTEFAADVDNHDKEFCEGGIEYGLFRGPLLVVVCS